MPTITITALDGDATGDSASPDAMTAWAPTVESGNIVHQFLNPGSIGVVLRGDLPRTGNLELRFFDVAAAEAARVLLGKPSRFSLEHLERPEVNMTFSRAGAMTPAIHDTNRKHWVFSVGFQELPA